MIFILVLNSYMISSAPEKGITRPRGYKTFSMLNSTEHEIFPAHKCVKIPTIVGILTFMSGKNSILGLSEPEKC